MACDVMAVRLHLAQIRVLEVVEDTPGALVVSVESTLLRLRCAQCGFKCRRVHDRRAKRVRDLEVSGRRMTLVWQRRRMVCSNCASRFLEEHPAFEGALTARLSRRVVADAKVMTFSAAARRHGVHWHAVRALVDTWSALVAERRRSRRCAVLLVDETSMRKRHRYVTVIVNGDTGRTLAMVEHRSSAALSAFLMQQGHRWCKGVKVVVSDGSKAYKAAIDAHLGHARHVLDRFHVIRWFAAVWVPIIRSWALTRGFALHSGTRNRYENRYTRTQHRPPSRQVNDHGRVSGTHGAGCMWPRRCPVYRWRELIAGAGMEQENLSLR